MITPAEYNRIALALPVLQHADAQLKEAFQQAATVMRIPAGHDVFVEGDSVDGIALLLSGVVRVYKIGETGREITLYRFGLGESCILTANAILSGQTFPAIATVEKEAEAVIIPSDAFQVWVQRFEPWRGFVFELLSHRLSSVMEIVEEVAFRRMDSRVSALLIDYGRKGNPVRMTHQEIARELGSSREVISRLMEDLSARGLVKVSRGEVEILDFEGLIEVAGK
jgi:CRP/FNR family transcriptional regulator